MFSWWPGIFHRFSWNFTVMSPFQRYLSKAEVSYFERFYWWFKENWHSYRGGNTVRIIFISPRKKCLLWKERICSLWSRNAFLFAHFPFQKGVGVQKANRVSQKVVSLVQNERKSTKYMSSVPYMYHIWAFTKTRLFKYTRTYTTKKRKFSDKKFWYSWHFCSKHILWVLVRTASTRRF